MEKILKKILIEPPFSIILEPILPKFIGHLLNQLDQKVQYYCLIFARNKPPVFWKSIQLEKLKRILLQAENIPYWKNKFAQFGFEPEKLQNLEEISKLPVTDRNDLKFLNKEEILAKNIAPWRFQENSTSGSSGEPLKIWEDKRDIFRRKIDSYFELKEMGIPMGKPLFILGLIRLTSAKDMGYQTPGNIIEDEKKRKEFFFPKLNEIKPIGLLTTPSYLRRLIYYMEKDKFKPARRIEGVRCYGETLDDHERKEIFEKALGCKVYSSYGTQEVSLIAIECRLYKFHLTSWMNYVEIVDEKGNRLPAGSSGTIVVTSFENECMPFIRYKIGDKGMITDEKCPCGNQNKILKFEGRIAGTIDFKDGTSFPLFFAFYYFSDNFSKMIKKFQIEQRGNEKLIFRYISYPEINENDLQERIKNYFQKIIKERLDIEIEKVEDILPQKSGKTPLYIKK